MNRLLRGVDRTGAIVAGVFVAGALVRLVFMVGYEPAFLGIPDSGSYIDSAHNGLFADLYHPAGYPLFVRVLHELYPHLGLLTFVQHVLGLATAALWYATVRKITGGRLLGLIPAAVVLFDGFGIWVEHAPLSDPLFGFLVAAAVYGAVRAARGPWWALALVAAAIVAAGTVRPVGFALALPIAVWLVFAQGGEGGRRFVPAAAIFAAVIAGAFGYALIQGSQTGVTQLTVSWGRLVYARSAQFADCSDFTPPAGTRRLCEHSPTGSRGSVNQYLTGAPDSARTSPGDRSISPAWRVFGPPPAGNSELAAFGRTAILHQPFDYVGAVARDFHYFWVDDHARFIDAAGRLDPNVVAAVSAYYADFGRGHRRSRRAELVRARDRPQGATRDRSARRVDRGDPLLLRCSRAPRRRAAGRRRVAPAAGVGCDRGGGPSVPPARVRAAGRRERHRASAPPGAHSCRRGGPQRRLGIHRGHRADKSPDVACASRATRRRVAST